MPNKYAIPRAPISITIPWGYRERLHLMQSLNNLSLSELVTAVLHVSFPDLPPPTAKAAAVIAALPNHPFKLPTQNPATEPTPTPAPTPPEDLFS